ncbi:MAG: lipopolysaccharide biosynthesis protein, partial [Candidatus Magasanikbacteria bacterium]
GSIVTFISTGVQALKKIALVPLFLWAWGQAMYGEWVTLYALISYLSLSDMGMGQFIKTRLTKLYSKGNKKDYTTTIKSALGVYSIITLLFLLVFVVFVFLAPFESWFGIKKTSNSTAITMLLLLGVYSLVENLFTPIKSMYPTLGEFVRGKVVQIVKKTLLIGFIALSLWMGGEFISVASWYLILTLVFLLFVWFDIRWRHPEIDFSKGKIDWDLSKSFILPGLTFLMVPLANLIKVEGSVLLIGGVLGASVVAYFNVHRTLVNMIRKATTIVQPSLQPEIAATQSRKQFKKLRKIHNLFLKAALSLTITSGTFLLFAGKDIIRIWTTGEIDFHLP